jgi:hypothetical protein
MAELEASVIRQHLWPQCQHGMQRRHMDLFTTAIVPLQTPQSFGLML